MNDNIQMFLNQFSQLERDEQKTLLGELLDKYTVNQTLIIKDLSLDISQFSKTQQAGVIVPIYTYDNGTRIKQKVFHVDDYLEYKEKLLYYRKYRKKLENQTLSSKEMQEYRESKKKLNPKLKH